MNVVNKQRDSKLEKSEIVERRKRTGKSKKGIIAALGVLAFLMVLYMGGTIYFRDRFFFNTQVNGIDLSRQTTGNARTLVESTANDFYISIIDEDTSENIYASEIDLKFIVSEEIEELLAKQNAFAWPLSLMNSQENDAKIEISFDEALFNQRISSLELVTNGQTSPVSANVMIEGTDVVIVPHQYGDLVDVERLQTLLKESISMSADEFNVQESDIFVQPKYETDSLEIVDAFETAKRYLSTEITYSVGTQELVDRTLISKWITINEDLDVHLDEEQVSQWLSEFSRTVNTGSLFSESGITREFKSHDGRDITVTGGYFGWIIDQELEFAELLENIRNGVVIEREPIYSQRGVTHGATDWGDTFLQVDLSKQHMWAIVDGEVVFDSPVVTGNPNNDRNTPQGVYSILEKLNPTVLISPWLDDEGKPTYEIPVEYWMRTTWSGYGFHDMPQPRYGGTQYRRTGSSGCTNMPLDKARELFGLTYIGMPVVVHY